jgi:hypothetical protein
MCVAREDHTLFGVNAGRSAEASRMNETRGWSRDVEMSAAIRRCISAVGVLVMRDRLAPAESYG